MVSEIDMKFGIYKTRWHPKFYIVRTRKRAHFYLLDNRPEERGVLKYGPFSDFETAYALMELLK